LVLKPETTYDAQSFRVDRLDEHSPVLLLTFCQLTHLKSAFSAAIVEMQLEALAAFLGTFSPELLAEVKGAPAADLLWPAQFSLTDVPPGRIGVTRAVLIRTMVGTVGAQLDFMNVLPLAVHHFSTKKEPVELSPALTVVIAEAHFPSFLRSVADAVLAANSTDTVPNG
jgi:hypothetical protein